MLKTVTCAKDDFENMLLGKLGESQGEAGFVVNRPAVGMR